MKDAGWEIQPLGYVAFILISGLSTYLVARWLRKKDSKIRI